MSINEILETIGKITVIFLGVFLAVSFGCSLLLGLLDFASTGFGAIILLLIGIKLYKDWQEKQ